KNTSLLPLNGYLIYNRLLWLGVSALVLGVTYWRYQFRIGGRGGKKKKQVSEEQLGENHVSTLDGTSAIAVQDFSRAASWRQYLWASRLEFVGVLKSIPFLVILALGAFNLVGSSSANDDLFGTPVYPVTNMILRSIHGSFLLFLFIIQT